MTTLTSTKYLQNLLRGSLLSVYCKQNFILDSFDDTENTKKHFFGGHPIYSSSIPCSSLYLALSYPTSSLSWLPHLRVVMATPPPRCHGNPTVAAVVTRFGGDQSQERDLFLNDISGVSAVCTITAAAHMFSSLLLLLLLFFLHLLISPRLPSAPARRRLAM